MRTAIIMLQELLVGVTNRRGAPFTERPSTTLSIIVMIAVKHGALDATRRGTGSKHRVKLSQT